MTKPKLWQQSIISMNKCSNLSVHQSWSQASYSSESNVSTWRQVCSSHSKNSRRVFLVPSILKLLRIRLANALRAWRAVRTWLILVFTSKAVRSYFARMISATSRLDCPSFWASRSATVDGRISVVRRGLIVDWTGFGTAIGTLISFLSFRILE